MVFIMPIQAPGQQTMCSLQVNVKFIDTEGGVIPTVLLQALAESFDDVSVNTPQVEQQLADNCVHQVINEFARDVLCYAVPQHGVVGMHSSLMEDALIAA